METGHAEGVVWPESDDACQPGLLVIVYWASNLLGCMMDVCPG